MSYLSLCGREWGGVGAYSRLSAYSNKYGNTGDYWGAKGRCNISYREFSRDVMSTIWCPNPRKRRSYWCPKPVLLELNLFLMKQFISLK